MTEHTSPPAPAPRRRWLISLLILAGAVAWAWGTDSAASSPSKPAATQDLPFRVPAGFVAERVAGPPLIDYPMFACFDDQGRLYVVDSAGVNLLPDALTKNPPHRIRLLQDTDGDGKFDKSTLFADKLTYPQGVLWHDGIVYTSSPPSLWRLQDTKGTGVADRRDELVTGFTFTKWADDLHGPFLGPDGRLYWTSGRYAHEVRRPGGPVVRKGYGPLLLRCRPDGGDIEAFCSGIGNPVEVAFTAEGEPFVAGTYAFRDHERDAIMHGVYGGVYPIKDRQTRDLRGVKPTGDLLPLLVHWPIVAPAGLVRYRDTGIGREYRDNLFSALFAGRAVQRHVLERDGATFRARTEDFIVQRSTDFHPTDVLEDADGSLLVVDTGSWYNLCNNAPVAKKPVKGGIYRIRRRGAPPVTDPRGLALPWGTMKARELVPLLDDTRFAVRDRALGRLARLGQDALPALRDLLNGGASVRARRNAVWALARLDGKEVRAAARAALADKDLGVRLAAVNVVGLHRDADALSRLTELVVSDAPPVRREAATALGRIRQGAALPALFQSLKAGGDPFVEHALIYALIEIADRPATLNGLGDPSPLARRAALIALDQMDGGDLTRDLVTPLLNTSDPALQKTALHIITTRPGWAGETLGLLRRWLARKHLSADHEAGLRGALLAFSTDPAVQALVAATLHDDRTAPATRLLLLETMAQAPLDRLPAAWVAELGRSLKHRDDRVVGQAVAAIRAAGLGDFDDRLRTLAEDPARAAGVRVAALAAAAPRLARVEPALFQFLVSRLDHDLPPLARLAAAEALGSVPLDDKQLEALAAPLAGAGALEMPHLLVAYERSRSPEVGRKLLAALDNAPGAPALAPDALRRTLHAYPPEVSQAAAPLLKRLAVDTQKQQARLAELTPVLSGGDAGRGRQVFFGKKAACAACHTVGGEGGRIGPDLSKIGTARAGPELLESIVFPSASFARGYEPYVLATRDGRLYTGLITRETADSVYLVTPERAEVRLARSAIDTMERGRVSVMPQGLDAQLSRQELADLIAFLQSRK